MTEPKESKSRGEWVITSDMDTVRKALAAMMSKRKLTQNALAVLMRITSNSMFANFLTGKQANLRLDSLTRAVEAMEFEIVIREKAPRTKVKERLAALKAERVASMGADDARKVNGYGDLVAKDDPDRELKLRLLDGMVDPANRSSLEDLFREIRETA